MLGSIVAQFFSWTLTNVLSCFSQGSKLCRKPEGSAAD